MLDFKRHYVFILDAHSLSKSYLFSLDKGKKKTQTNKNNNKQTKNNHKQNDVKPFEAPPSDLTAHISTVFC